MIGFDALKSGYGSADVLRGVSGDAGLGEFIGLLGANGCGKSTLIKTLIGQIKPSSGTALLDGKAVHSYGVKARARRLAYLPQSRSAAWAITARDLVALGRAPYRGPLGRLSEAGDAAVTEAMERTQTLDLAGRIVSTLSGGEQARVHLARALAVQAPVLIADEPIAALDPFYQLTMMERLKSEAGRGAVVIAALHDLALAAQYCGRIWVMYEGRIIADDAPNHALSASVLKTAFGIAAPKGGFQVASLAPPRDEP